MPIRYNDLFVQKLFEDVYSFIAGEIADRRGIEDRLVWLARTNLPEVMQYWDRRGAGHGIPDSAFKTDSLYFFNDEPPVRIFCTSGTTGSSRGMAPYSPRGLELMDHSICFNARTHIFENLDRPAIIRFAPCTATAPQMVMAYGMEVIAKAFGHRVLNVSVVGPGGLDLGDLERALDACVSEAIPTILLGGSLAIASACELLEQRGRRWQLPEGSCMIDAGGSKGRSKNIHQRELRSLVARSFGVEPTRCKNLFGMTELASQLYDGVDRPLGPQGERPKGGTHFVQPRLRDPWAMELQKTGIGLLEVADLCILDRPHIVLTGDLAIASPDGVAVIGRIEREHTRGCALAFEMNGIDSTSEEA